MALKLRVISDHYKALGKQSSRVFVAAGGRIGRADDNDWVLPDADRYVSSHHCRVDFRGGRWILEDTSTNGVFINGSDTPAALEGPHQLQDGDRLRLGDYQILVSIGEGKEPAGSPPPAVAPRARPTPRRASAPVEDLGEELDLTDLLSESVITRGPPQLTQPPAPSAPPPAPRAPATPLDLVKALGLDDDAPPAQSRRLPQPPPRGGVASLLDAAPAPTPQRAPANPRKEPDDWQMQTRPYDLKTLTALTSPSQLSDRPEKRDRAPEPPRARRTADASSGSDLSAGVEAFCRGAGIDPQALPADAQNALLTLAGQMVREVVLGLMEALKTPTDMKNRLRMAPPAAQGRENNPLKFSTSVDEAVLKLLDPRMRYLGPVDAIRDSFADLHTHQIALAAAMQAAADELMSRIEPGELQERFDRGLKRGALLGAANKMKYWDLYVEFHHALNQRNDQGLPTLFAEALARAYAERTESRK